jgi:hypothetical protein
MSTNSYKNDFITQSDLKAIRGWTDKLIKKYYPVADKKKANPHYRNASPMKLYKIQSIKEIENTAEFIQDMERSYTRKQGGIRATRTKELRTTEIINDINFLIKVIPFEDLLIKAVEKYSSGGRNVIDLWNVDKEFFKKISRYYVRNELTDYDWHLDKLYRIVGKEKAYARLEDKLMDRIIEVYPELK